MVRLGTVWVGSFALYLLLAGQISWTESLTGIAVACLLTAWTRRLGDHVSRSFAWSGASLQPLERTLRHLLPGTGSAGLALLSALFGRRHPGYAALRPFLYGRSDDPEERGRRALAVLLSSLAPDGFVLRLDSGRDEALIHRLSPIKAPADPRWLA